MKIDSQCVHRKMSQNALEVRFGLRQQLFLKTYERRQLTWYKQLFLRLFIAVHLPKRLYSGSSKEKNLVCASSEKFSDVIATF